MKHKTMKLLIVSLVLAMSLGLLSGCGNNAAQPSGGGEGSSASGSGSSDPVVLRLSGQHAETNDTTVAIQVLADEVKERTEGRVVIEIYPGNTLGNPTEGLTMLDTGVCDMVWTSPAFFAGQFPMSECLEVPMLGITDGVMATEIYWDVMEKYGDQFTEFDSYYPWILYGAASTIVGTRSTIVNSVSDLKGLTLRTSAGTNASIATNWGASPASVAPPDLYMALEKGTVDGFLFNASTLNSWKLGELTECCVDMGLGYSQCFILCSKDSIAKLSPEDQAILAEVGGRAGSIYMAECTEKEAGRAIDEFTAAGGTYKIIRDGDPLYAELKEPLASVTADWVARVSSGSFDAQQVVDFMTDAVANYAP